MIFSIKSKGLRLMGMGIFLNYAFLVSTHYYSQFGQDLWLYKNIFEEKEELFFVEVGASDGKNLSNTLFFEEALNWKGICIEAIPEKYNQLKANRRCHCENLCVGSSKKEIPFIVIQGYPGFEKHGCDSTLLSGRLDTWERQNSKVLNTSNKQVLTLITKPLKDILDKYNVTQIDYLSIDVEGGELEVLKGINWNATTIGVISIENNYNRNDTRQLLREKGYVMVKRLKLDDIWVNPNYITTYHNTSDMAAILN